MTKRIRVKDISRNPPEQLVHLEAEDLMPLPCCQGELDDNPSIRPLTKEQMSKYECSLDGLSAIQIPKPQSKEEEDKLVAMLENAVVELEDHSEELSDLQNIITEMVVNEYLRESQDLSIMLAESFGRSLSRVPRLHTGVGQANFFVLNGAFMPSVLVEMAFISNPEEEKLLASRSFHESVATAIFGAIMEFKRRYSGGM